MVEFENGRKDLDFGCQCHLGGQRPGNGLPPFQRSELPTKIVTKFKKKEDLDKMAKSVLKHRIKLLTGKSVTEMEDDIQHQSLDGTGFNVEELRKMAHLLILQASDELPTLSPSPIKAGSKRKADEADANDTKTTQNDVIARPMRRATRKSLAPELLRVQDEKVDCRLKQDLQDVDELNLGPNPTPHMIARKRKSLAVASISKKSPKKVAPKKDPSNLTLSIPEPMEQDVVKVGNRRKKRGLTPDPDPAPVEKKSRKSAARSMLESIAKPVIQRREPKVGFCGEDGQQIYMGQSPMSRLTLQMFQSKIKDFQGANLTVLHTPVTWDPPDVFTLVRALRAMNKAADLKTYTVLVGCGLDNVHMFREALHRQTKHVQFLVLERDDKDLEFRGKLREATSFFLLAYFFDGCESETPAEIPPMVRPGATTCFRTESAEDLENQIVHTFTEKGDWILDLFCGERELCLAAQKTGRNGVAVHDRLDQLLSLKVKAAAIAEHYDPDFQPDSDGVLLQF